MKKTIQRIGVLSVSLLTLAISANAQWSQNATSVYLTNGTKNVGIGTTAPSYPLDIKQAGNCNFRVQSITSGSANLILARSAASGNNCLVNYKTGTTALWFTGVAGTNTDFRIRNGAGTDYVFVAQTSGNVGIGTTSPAYKMDVVGDISVNSNKVILAGGNNYLQNVAGVTRLVGFNGGVLGGTVPDVDIIKWNWNGSTPSVNINGAVDMNSTLNVAGVATLASNLTVAGTVGIGTTTPSTFGKLHVAGGNIAVDGGSTLGLKWVNGNTLQADIFRFGAVDNRLYVTNNGNGNLTGVYLASGGVSWVSTSDKRLKENIRETTYGLDAVLKLSVKEYNYTTTKEKDNHIGFLAQEVYKVIPELVAKGDDGAYQGSANAEEAAKTGFRPWGVDYAGFTPILVKAIQEQQLQIADLKSENEQLKQTVDEMKSCVESICNTNTSKTIATENSTTQLFQNSPNPFNQTTVIKYALNRESNNGRIIIRDLNGNLVKQINIAETGRGQVTISANELTQGTYTYTLEIAGTSVDTKLMVVTK